MKKGILLIAFVAFLIGCGSGSNPMVGTKWEIAVDGHYEDGTITHYRQIFFFETDSSVIITFFRNHTEEDAERAKYVYNKGVIRIYYECGDVSEATVDGREMRHFFIEDKDEYIILARVK